LVRYLVLDPPVRGKVDVSQALGFHSRTVDNREYIENLSFYVATATAGTLLGGFASIWPKRLKTSFGGTRVASANKITKEA
jgi:hypothetical protein